MEQNHNKPQKKKKEYYSKNIAYWERQWLRHCLNVPEHRIIKTGIWWNRIRIIWTSFIRVLNNKTTMSGNIEILMVVIKRESDLNFFDLNPDHIASVVKTWMKEKAETYAFLSKRRLCHRSIWASAADIEEPTSPLADKKYKRATDIGRTLKIKREAMEEVLRAAKRLGIISVDTKVSNYIDTAIDTQQREIAEMIQTVLTARQKAPEGESRY